MTMKMRWNAWKSSLWSTRNEDGNSERGHKADYMGARPMNGATFRAHRKWLQLSHEECAELLDINDPKTVRNWEAGRSYIPEGVAEEIQEWAHKSYIDALADGLAMAVTQAAATVIVYARPEDVPSFLEADKIGIYAYSNARSAVLLVLAADLPAGVRLIEFDPEDFRVWLEASNLEPSLDAQRQWAKETADAQEKEHNEWLNEKAIDPDVNLN